MSDASSNADRLLFLADAVCDGRATPAELAELDGILLADEAARTRYLNYCQMCFTLELDLQAAPAVRKAWEQIGFGEAKAAVAPPVSYSDASSAGGGAFLPINHALSDACCGAIRYFSSGWPLAYLITSVIFATALMVGYLTPARSPDPKQVATQPNDAATKDNGESSNSVADAQKTLCGAKRPVGRIADMECRLASGRPCAAGDRFVVGRRFLLAAGWMEIVYDSGAHVILQGPCEYTVESSRGGFLAVGQLTAKLEKSGSGSGSGSAKTRAASPTPTPTPTTFVIATPTAIVTDLGTEFGVDVDRDKATTVRVLRGEVEATRDARNGVPICERLHAGQAIYIASLNDLPIRLDLSEHPSLASSQQRAGGRGVRMVLSPDVKTSLRQVVDARNSQGIVKPIGLVATAYHDIYDAQGKLVAKNDRDLAFHVATDDIFSRGVGDERPRSCFDTALVASGQWPVVSNRGEGRGARDEGTKNRLAPASTPGEKVGGGPQAVGGAKPQAAENQQSVASGLSAVGGKNTGKAGDALSTTHDPRSTKLPTAHCPLPTVFVGLRYDHAVRFDRIKVFLARQEKEGGGWAETPRVFILKNPVDTNTTSPENDPADWHEISRHPVYGAAASQAATPGPGAVLEFALTGTPEQERTGYGWAVGGVRANGSVGYVSVTELRAYGVHSTKMKEKPKVKDNEAAHRAANHL